MTFVQVIELNTTRVPEIEALIDDWLAKTEGQRSAQRGLLTKDQDRADTYVQMVEFPSYEAAMANSKLPATSAFAERLTALCEKPPVFMNLDVIRVDDFGSAGADTGRKVADCRDFPSENGCTLTIAGEVDELLSAAVQHAVSVHGHDDNDELRSWLREHLKAEVPA